MHGWLSAALITAVVVVVVVRRLRSEPLNARDLFGPPVVLTALGTWSLWQRHELHHGLHHGLGPADWAWIAAGIVLGLATGALRGATVRVEARQGVLWQRYTGWTFLVAAGSLGVMAAFSLLAEHAGLPADARPVQLSIGVGFLGEAVAVGLRGLTSGIPFAPEHRSPSALLGLDRADRADRLHRSDRTDRADHADHLHRSDHADHLHRSDHADHTDRVHRSDRTDRAN
ncbi:hypothetical protein [Kitasatospora sp. NPDC059673]|uniref:hypothetical protein n=1 Tax=Kitasatospora sp. NPDC059673 TaxID=3346901 RepID=UPI0036752374